MNITLKKLCSQSELGTLLYGKECSFNLTCRKKRRILTHILSYRSICEIPSFTYAIFGFKVLTANRAPGDTPDYEVHISNI
jgi:hypothetical protein